VFAWTALALAGLAIAVTVTYTATRLVGEHIGLSAEPRVEGSRLIAPTSRTRSITGGPPDVRRAARIVGARVSAAAGPSAATAQPPPSGENGDEGGDGEGDD
jgi:hypothetical protein